MPIRLVHLSSLALLLPLAIAMAGAVELSKLEQRQRAREVAIQTAGIDRALSKEMPPAVAALPVFGTINWTEKEMPLIAPGPHAGVSGFGMVVVGGQIYVLGGFIPGGDETDEPSRRTSRWAHRYDPKSGRWSKLPQLPGRREYTRAIAAEDAVYVMGGGIQKPRTGLNYEACAEVFRLDTGRRSLRWESVASLNVPRTHMAVGKAGDQLVVSGGNRYDYAEQGYSARTIQGVTETLDLTDRTPTWKLRQSIPGSPRGWSASASLNDRLFLFGGLAFAETEAGVRGPKIKHQESLCYDPKTDRWTRLTEPPTAVSGWEGAAYRQRYVILIGGVSKRWSDLAFVYDTKDDRWLRFDNALPCGGILNDAGVCIIGDTIYVAGGEGPGGSHFNHFLIGTIKPR
jgi:N-acetylneuraminic acid mutarotase